MKPLPIAIISPHGGLRVPPELEGRTALNENQIFNEADAYADQIFDFADRVLYWETFPYARALLDMNRPANSLLHHRLGDGVVKRVTSYGEPIYHPRLEPEAELEQFLIHRYWEAWHDRLAMIAADKRVKLVIDCHTMAAVGPDAYDDPTQLRPRVMVANLGDIYGNLYPLRKRLSASPEATRLLAQQLGELLADLSAFTETGPDSAVNTPFWGGWDLWAHGGYQQPWLMIELNRALYIGLQSVSTPIVPPDHDRIATLRELIWQGIETVTQVTCK
jgi:N-formylglutamate deformylase